MSMRSALLVAALSGAALLAVPASADVVSSQKPQAADIGPMLGVHLGAIAARADNEKLGFAKKRLVILGAELMRPDMAVWGVLFPADDKKKIVLRRVGKPTVVQSGDVAWFQQSYQYKYIVGTESVAGNGRVNGLAIADGGRWQIVGMHYADQIGQDRLRVRRSRARAQQRPSGRPRRPLRRCAQRGDGLALARDPVLLVGRSAARAVGQLDLGVLRLRQLLGIIERVVEAARFLAAARALDDQVCDEREVA
ncbi:hypothetical protein BH11MYX2_BH11MYX2_14670 [soil metagenome]